MLTQTQKNVLKFLAANPDQRNFLKSEFSGCAKGDANLTKALCGLVEKGVL